MKTFCLALETSEPQITGGWEGIRGRGKAYNNDRKVNEVTFGSNFSSSVLKVKFVTAVRSPASSLQDHLLGVVFPFSDVVFTFWRGRIIF